MKHVLYTHPYRHLILLCIVSVLFVIPKSSGAPGLATILLYPSEFNAEFKDTEMEFPFDTNKAQKQYRETINCFINVAIQKEVEILNKKIEEQNPQVKPFPNITDAETQCDNIKSKGIRGKLYTILKDIYIPSISKNKEMIPVIEDISKKEITACNLNLLGKNKKPIPPSFSEQPKETDYFGILQSQIISPTYAASIVSNCYLTMYQLYLDRISGEKFIINDVQNQGSGTAEDVFKMRTKQGSFAKKEKEKVGMALDLALSSVEEMISTYPLHLQYATFIERSERIRDLIAKIRVAWEQLRYKLTNQSFPS